MYRSDYRKSIAKKTGWYLLLGCVLFFLPSSVSGQLKAGSAKEESLELTNLIPDTRIVINAPCNDLINRKLPTRVIFYALPNGNSIEQTAGKLIKKKNDPVEWRFDIQHIAAQTRFLREKDLRYNYIVVYLEASMRAWSGHTAKYPDSPKLYNHLVDTICHILSEKYASIERMEVTLSSHSGGGRFLFNYINGVKKIP